MGVDEMQWEFKRITISKNTIYKKIGQRVSALQTLLPKMNAWRFNCKRKQTGKRYFLWFSQSDYALTFEDLTVVRSNGQHTVDAEKEKRAEIFNFPLFLKIHNKHHIMNVLVSLRQLLPVDMRSRTSYYQAFASMIPINRVLSS